ncbi:MAG: hypothetical protein IT384_17645 [Deltaproteobacteria bacterium]|nr:hypothetical protein [Deltaproteobacteria bacterium]
MYDNTESLNLEDLAHALIAGVVTREPTVREGTVMTVGPPPYRRLDCDGRALAYVRTRPRKRAVRIDVSGLWLPAPGTSRIAIPSATGSATLLVRTRTDLEEAVAYLLDAVLRTRGWTDRGVRRLRF